MTILQPSPLCGLWQNMSGVLFYFCILHELNFAGISVDHPCARNHDDQGDKEQETWYLPEDDEGQRHTDEWRDGVVGAGLCRAEIPLSVHIAVNAQTVGDEAQKQYFEDVTPSEMAELLS